MMGIPSPSHIARLALGLEASPTHTESQHTHCAACGAPLAAGSPSNRFKPTPSTFTDFQYLCAVPTNGEYVICQDCRQFAGPGVANVMTATQYCVLSAQDGAAKLTNDAHRTWLLLTPPSAPFVAMISTQKRQHLVWRARVTLDPDLIYIQIGRRSLSIDRQRALAAVKTCAEAAQLARDLGLKVTPQHPFQRLDRGITDPRHAQIAAPIRAAAQRSAALREAIECLLQLGPGEQWALSILAKAKPEDPVREKFSL